MNDFAMYLIKSASWITGFALVYFFFLRHERFFMLKRIFLLSGILASSILPLFTAHYTVPAPQVPEALFPGASDSYATTTSQAVTTGLSESFDYSRWLLILYITGLMVLIARITLNIYRIASAIKKTKTHRKEPFTSVIRSSEFPSSFSFFNYVFINPSVEETEFREIINHELAHVKQKHWIDLVLVEVLRILQWANPFAWIYTSFIKLNHEHLADEAALRHSTDPAMYKAVLINQMFRSPVFSFSNSFNYSLNKNRFEMMKKIITSPYRKLKVLFILPVFAFVFYAFSEPVYNGVAVTPDQGNSLKGTVVKQDGQPLANVAIAVTGTTIRAKSDQSGQFTLSDIPAKAHLVFSGNGYLTQMLKYQKGKPLQVVMEKDTTYIPVKNVLIEALVVIDGKISETKYPQAIEDLSPLQIDNMLVLKGESAEQKYGEKGKNGVIEITTKQNQTGGNQQQVMNKAGDNTPYVVVESMPMYPGGDENLLKTIAENTVYPENAKNNKIEGRVIIRFVVTKEGKVADATVLKGVDPELNAEALRVMGTLQDFTPGTQGGKPVDVYYMVPITFSISPGSKEQVTGSTASDGPYVMVEVMPEYPGGDENLLKTIAENTVYPANAKKNGIQGRVIIRFVVTKEGKVADATVLKGVDPELNAEALRVMGTLQNFTPGTQGGKPVDVYYMVPINFGLN